MCSVLGLLVRQSDPRLRGAGARVFIANHVTPFDHNVVSLLTSCNTVRTRPGLLPEGGARAALPRLVLQWLRWKAA